MPRQSQLAPTSARSNVGLPRGARADSTQAKVGAPGRIRTCGLWLRRPTLYPAELRALRSFAVVRSAQCQTSIVKNQRPRTSPSTFDPCPLTLIAKRSGAPGRTRTCGLLVRSQSLYPTELRA